MKQRRAYLSSSNNSLSHPRSHLSHPTITLDDTPSPAVSVITISDSSSEGEADQGTPVAAY